jgi:transposase-like protein
LVLSSWIANNNRSLTSFEEYLKVVSKTGVPEFCRADDGTETKAMEKMQKNLRGDRTFLKGPSTANVRVEVHHGRVTKKALAVYRQCFSNWEETWLNAYDPLHRFLLWHVFAVRIQEDMSVYVDVWNHHRIRTTGVSPIKAFHNIPHRRLPLPGDNATAAFVNALRVMYAFDVDALNPLTPTEYAELERLCPRLTLLDSIDLFLPRCVRGLQVLSDIFNARDDERQ